MARAKLRSAPPPPTPSFYVFGVTRSGIEPQPPSPRADMPGVESPPSVIGAFGVNVPSRESMRWTCWVPLRPLELLLRHII